MDRQAHRTFPSWKDGWLVGLTGLLALGVRVIALGRDPLSPEEARLALEALAWTQGAARDLVAVPLYPWWTGLLFFLFEPNDFWARFWPALLGSLLVVAPWWVFPETPRSYKVALALVLALDPALVLASRTAHGAMWAIPWLLFAVGALRRGRTTLGLVLTLLALYGGWSGWWGLLLLAVAWGLWSRLYGVRPSWSLSIRAAPVVATAWVLFLGMGLYRPGLAGMFQSLLQGLADFAQGWSGFMALWPFLAYQGPLLVAWLGVTLWDLRRDEPSGLRIAPWVALVAAVLWWLYPGREPGLAVWVNLGLWPGLVWGFLQLRPEAGQQRDLAWLLTLFHVGLWMLLFSQLALLIQEIGFGSGPFLLWRGALVVLAAFLLGLSGLTWTTLMEVQPVRTHVLLAFLFVMVLGQFSGWTRIWEPPSQRLWETEVSSSSLRALETTWQQWALWTHGRPEEMEGWSTVQGKPELRWALRWVRSLWWTASPPRQPTTLPEVLLTPKPAPPVAEDGRVLPPVPELPFDSPVPYRAQDFAVREQVLPFSQWSQGWLWVFHLQTVPTQQEEVLFWLRSDRFLEQP